MLFRSDRLKSLLDARHAAGLAKYGTTVDRTDLTPDQWAQHALEELLDGAAYLMRLKEEMEKREARIAALEAHVATLEEAGNSLADESHPTMFCDETTTKRKVAAMDAWEKAKESKP